MRLFGWRSAKKIAITAAPAAEQVLRLLDTADLPLCSSAIHIALAIVDLLHGLSDNDDTCSVLIGTVESYTTRIRQLMEDLTPDYILHAEDAQAVRIRQAIHGFESDLHIAQASVSSYTTKSPIRRFLEQSSDRSELVKYKAQLEAARKKFNDMVHNIILTHVVKRTVISKAEAELDDYGIIGAKRIPPTAIDVHAMDQVRSVDCIELPASRTFWEDTYQAKVEGRRRVVKVYYKRKTGGKEAFVRDLKSLAENPHPNTPSVYGYCDQAATPVIVFSTSQLLPFANHICQIYLERPEDALAMTWKLIADMINAGHFLYENNELLSFEVLRFAVEDAAVDETGRVFLYPSSKGKPEMDMQIISPLGVVTSACNHSLVDPSRRGLRRLWLSLAAANKTDKLRLPPPEAAISTWASIHERPLYWWYSTADPAEALIPGDIGTFEVDPVHGTSRFRLLGNVANRLGGTQVEDPNTEFFPEVSPGIFRGTLEPTPRAAMRFCRPARLNHAPDPHSLKSTLIDIASEFGVNPTELVLVKYSIHLSIRVPVLNVSERLTRPLYLYIKYGSDMRRISEWWWSESPSWQDSLSNVCSHVDGLRLPGVELNDRRYIIYSQLESEDVSSAQFASITPCV